MRVFGKAKESIKKILEAFENGNVSTPLATIFLSEMVDPSKPSHQWSMCNRLLCALAGCTDARGFRQWERVGRVVQKGEKAATAILVPCFKLVDAPKNEDRKIRKLTGFKAQAVFDVSQTEGESLEQIEVRANEFINGLPLVEVAQAWNITVYTYTGSESRPEGIFSYRIKSDTAGAIGIGVANAQVFLHELVHAADKKLGNIATGPNKLLRNELVAELGAVTLAEMLGLECSDTGSAWQYIQTYAERAGVQPITACFEVLNDTAAAVQAILAEYQKIEGVSA